MQDSLLEDRGSPRITGLCFVACHVLLSVNDSFGTKSEFCSAWLNMAQGLTSGRRNTSFCHTHLQTEGITGVVFCSVAGRWVRAGRCPGDKESPQFTGVVFCSVAGRWVRAGRCPGDKESPQFTGLCFVRLQVAGYARAGARVTRRARSSLGCVLFGCRSLGTRRQVPG